MRSLCALLVVLFLAGCSEPRGGPSGFRVVVVGLDGATPAVLQKLVEAGRMPKLERFLGRSASGLLDAPIHKGITSPALWTMAVTGVPPERHGITHFVLPVPGRSQKVPAASGHRTAPALWNILSDHGLRSGIVGLWATWPAETILGAIVSDHVSFSRTRESRRFRDGEEVIPFDYDTSGRNVHPASLSEAITSLVRVPQDIEAATLRRFAEFSDEQVREIRDSPYDGSFNIRTDPFQELKFTVQSDRSYAAIGLRVQEEVDPALLLVYLQGIDVIQHAFWAHRAGLRRVRAVDRKRYKDVVDRYYEYTDELIAPYLEMASDDTVVLLLSDHGYRTAPEVSGGHWHDRTGILFAAGGPVRPGASLESEGDLLDVTPTVLALLGLPVARDMPGRVWNEWLDEDFLAEHPVERIESYGSRPIRPEDVVESEIDEAWRDRLEKLGYLDDGEGD